MLEGLVFLALLGCLGTLVYLALSLGRFRRHVGSWAESEGYVLLPTHPLECVRSARDALLPVAEAWGAGAAPNLFSMDWRVTLRLEGAWPTGRVALFHLTRPKVVPRHTDFALEHRGGLLQEQIVVLYPDAPEHILCDVRIRHRNRWTLWQPKEALLLKIGDASVDRRLCIQAKDRRAIAWLGASPIVAALRTLPHGASIEMAAGRLVFRQRILWPQIGSWHRFVQGASRFSKALLGPVP